MRRALLIAALAAAALPATAGAARLPASAKLVSCSVERHEAAFYARMTQTRGSTSMLMRFTLLEGASADAFQRVKAPGIRRWRQAKPGVRVFGYRQVFRNLAPLTSYRVRVDFRWYDSADAEIARASRRSGRCNQWVGLPNLVGRIGSVGPSSVPGVLRYVTVVRNRGKATATSVPVRLTVDDKVVDTRRIASLAPGERRRLVFRGPACTTRVRLEVDPDRVIAESSDADNTHAYDCAALRNTR
jgi:CARDB